MKTAKKLLFLFSDNGPVFAQDFLTTPALSSSFNFSRASGANYFNADGVLQNASTNEARFDHDLSGGPLGLTLEGASTNLALHSRDLSNAAWSKTNATAVQDQVGIDGGTSSASILTATSADGTALQSVTATSGTYIFSAYVKRHTGTGTVEITVDGGTTWSDVTIEVGSDYNRVYVSQAAVTNPEVGFRLGTSSDAIVIDGCQLEAESNSTGPSTVVFTTTPSVTRAQDVTSDTSVNYLNVDGSDVLQKNTFFFQFRTPYVPSGLVVAANYSDDSFNNRVSIRVSGASLSVQVVSGGTTQANFAENSFIEDGDIVKIALALENNNVRLKASSTSSGTRALQTDTTATMPVITRLDLGHYHNNAAEFYGQMQKVQSYNRVLTDDEIGRLI